MPMYNVDNVYELCFVSYQTNKSLICEGPAVLHILFQMSHNGDIAFQHSGLLLILLYQCLSVCRRRRSGQNDGAEDEGGGGEEEDKRNRGEDVFGGNERAGSRSRSSLPIMHSACSLLAIV